ncbi:extracellular catalytic domain type 1 short-chain-length polyhydroxyalkanoate depolymerase [Oligella urethralis]|uniref:Poly(3-hydroxybutyrate) depolymerase n=1 Tax=Oligella urethralis TaxID=90245 RepID=A0A2X1UQ76_9BURK|nr:PHB depolymerase family esterase [Oligella urethralis]SPY09257.1 Poly(3-hydroxybutyrate) depolymerase [Oligella urethralis]
MNTIHKFEFVEKHGFANLEGKWLEPVLKNSSPIGLFNFQQLEYAAYFPKNKAQTKLPLIVMIHGCGQSANSFAAGTRMNEYAEQYGFAVLYPYQNTFRNMNNCWHWFDADSRQNIEEKNSVVELLSAMVEAVDSIDPERIYLAGISSGAALAGHIAMDYSHLFAGLALHSCPMFPLARNAAGAIRIMKDGCSEDIADIPVPINYIEHPLPLMIIHGEKDDYVNPLNAEQLKKWFSSLNRKAGRIHQTSAQPVRLKMIPDLWHGWANGNPDYRYNEVSDFDASKEILKFFHLHNTK